MTADELLTLPSDDLCHELVRGEHRVNPPPGPRHGLIGMRIGMLLAQHVVTHRLGVVFNGDTGFLLERNPDTVRAPDASFVSTARIPAEGIGNSYLEGAPDLAVEVLSPSDSMIEVEDKVDQYLAAGARLVWVVNPKLGRVTEYAPNVALRVLRDDDRLDGGDVVPGFSCGVHDILSWPA